jgi:hypothetical protein
LQRSWTGEPFLLSELLVTRAIVIKNEYVGLALQPSEYLHRSAEANSLSRLDRLLVRFGEPGDDALRISLREYANSIAKDEWPELSKGRASGRTTRLFREFTENVTAIEPEAWTPELDLCGPAQTS